jgi:hypothetical protein
MARKKIRDVIETNGMVFAWEDPSGLIPHPANYRQHGERQRAAFGSTLRKMGWLEPLVANRITRHVLDGHLRQEEGADQRPGEKVPVIWIEIPEDREASALGVINTIREMATNDDALLERLALEIKADDMDIARALFEIEAADPPKADDPTPRAKDVFQQRCFQLHDDQAKNLIDALATAKKHGHGKSSLSTNSNGNALAYIARHYLNTAKEKES